MVSNGYLSASSVSSAERDNYGYDFCVAYTKCVATPWYDRIYLYICTRELSACHLVQYRSIVRHTNLSQPS